jgi:hypothetical protein
MKLIKLFRNNTPIQSPLTREGKRRPDQGCCTYFSLCYPHPQTEEVSPQPLLPGTHQRPKCLRSAFLLSSSPKNPSFQSQLICEVSPSLLLHDAPPVSPGDSCVPITSSVTALQPNPPQPHGQGPIQMLLPASSQPYQHRNPRRTQHSPTLRTNRQTERNSEF